MNAPVVIGLDWWNVASHHHPYFSRLAEAHQAAGDTVVIISAVGRSRAGTVAAEAKAAGYLTVPVHEVVFDHPRESPERKLAMCRHLGVTVFYDDRADVCILLRANGILALQVPRADGRSDIAAERAGAR